VAGETLLSLKKKAYVPKIETRFVENAVMSVTRTEFLTHDRASAWCLGNAPLPLQLFEALLLSVHTLHH